jgi:hypothetical protein
MANKPNMTFAELIQACAPHTECEIDFDVPDPGYAARYFWRVRWPGRGVYMGDAVEDERGDLKLESPNTFVPETELRR